MPFVLALVLTFVLNSFDNPVKDFVSPYVDKVVSFEVNEETGLTDITVAGHTFNVTVEYRYDFND